MPLFSLFLFEKFFLFKPSLVQTSTWPLTQPSLALSQESCSRPWAQAQGFSFPDPQAGPRDLIVLKHSSSHLIFQSPLYLWSPIFVYARIPLAVHCSSDQLGVSLVPRGSGLCSHLSCHHLPTPVVSCFVLLNMSSFEIQESFRKVPYFDS